MKPLFPKACWAALAVAVLTVSCRQESVTPAPVAAVDSARTFMVTGVVERIVFAERHAIIRHEKIPGYMAAMTMRFDVKNTNEFSGLQTGDAIIFRYVVTEKEDWIEQVKKTGTAPAPTKPSAKIAVPRFLDELEIGAALPGGVFTNQFGQARTLASLRGRPVVLTFLFTRCNLPHVCGHTGAEFARLSRETTNAALLCVTLDPARDTPKALRAYAEKTGAASGACEFLTGDLETIRALAARCGVARVAQADTIAHNVRVLLFGADGRLARIIKGSEWSGDTVRAELAAVHPQNQP